MTRNFSYFGGCHFHCALVCCSNLTGQVKLKAVVLLNRLWIHCVAMCCAVIEITLFPLGQISHTTAMCGIVHLTRTRRRVKTLGQHQVGVNLQSHAQHQLWISTWHIFHEFHKIMPGQSYPVSLVNQNVILVNISHWRLHMAWIVSLMST